MVFDFEAMLGAALEVRKVLPGGSFLNGRKQNDEEGGEKMYRLG
jgi:hypothetical protein